VGNGAGLDVDLPIGSVDDVGGGFEILRRHGWLTEAGRFAIHQLGLSWHGAGAAAFVQALSQQAERNLAEPDLRPHGEEHAVYFDEYRPRVGSVGGPYSLVLRVLVGSTPRVLGAQLSMQLDGIPVDSSALRTTMDAFSVGDRAAFRSLASKKEVMAFQEGAIPLRVRQEIASEVDAEDPDTWISGVVADNPFRTEALQSRLHADVRSVLQGVDTVVCSSSAR